MTEKSLSVMLERYLHNLEMERKYRKIAETYEIEIIKLLIIRLKGEE